MVSCFPLRCICYSRGSDGRAPQCRTRNPGSAQCLTHPHDTLSYIGYSTDETCSRGWFIWSKLTSRSLLYSGSSASEHSGLVRGGLGSPGPSLRMICFTRKACLLQSGKGLGAQPCPWKRGSTRKYHSWLIIPQLKTPSRARVLSLAHSASCTSSSIGCQAWTAAGQIRNSHDTTPGNLLDSCLAPQAALELTTHVSPSSYCSFTTPSLVVTCTSQRAAYRISPRPLRYRRGSPTRCPRCHTRPRLPPPPLGCPPARSRRYIYSFPISPQLAPRSPGTGAARDASWELCDHYLWCCCLWPRSRSSRPNPPIWRTHLACPRKLFPF